MSGCGRPRTLSWMESHLDALGGSEAMRHLGRCLWIGGLASMACSGEELLTLGRSVATADSSSTSVVDAGPVSFTFEAPVLVTELQSQTKDDNPTLTWDMTEIYFTSTRGGDADLWWARRDNVSQPFGEPQLLAELSTTDFDTSPAVDGDGLGFWFATAALGGAGGLDILRSVRANRETPWETPVLVPELNSDNDDIPRPVGAGGLVMPLGSRRGGGDYLTYLATREDQQAPFSEIQELSELAGDEEVVADAFLDADGLTLLFARAPVGEPADLFWSTRASVDEPFGESVAVLGLNTEADERDPWLSPNGQTLFFSSDRDGNLAIYQATRQ